MARFYYFKLKQNGTSEKTLNFLFHFLRNRTQRVALKRQASSLADMDVRVPHGSTYGPLLFLMYKYIIYIYNIYIHNIYIYTETLLFSVFCNVNTSADEVNNNLVKFN